MMIRVSKCSLLFGVALFFSLVVFNNTTDYNSNYQFVQHVLSMDSTFPANHGLWRAMRSGRVYTLFYFSIIVWEASICFLCWWGLLRLVRTLKAADVLFQQAKSIPVAALTLGCLLWFIAFIDVGGEWFLMWQSKTWNGQDAAFRMFVVLCLILIYLTLPERQVSSSPQGHP